MNGLRPYVLVWHVAIAVTLLGVLGLSLERHAGGQILATVGGAGLAAFVLVASWRRSRKALDRPLALDGVLPAAAGGLALAVAVATSFDLLPLVTEARVVALATCAQMFLFAVDRYSADTAHNTRWRVLALGHGAVVLGSILELGLVAFRPGAALLLYATGFSLLLLHAFWMFQLDNSIVPPQPNTGPRHSEAILLTALIVGNVGVVVASFSVAVVFAIPTTVVTEFASLVAGCAAVVAFNMLVAPHSPPGRLDPLTGTIATVTQHAAIAIVILNLLVLTVFFVAPGAFFWMFGVYLVLLSIGVATEYLQVGYVHRRNDEPTPPLPDDPELTVVVSAAFEADVLPESLRHNLETLGDVLFLVVPAVLPLRARRPSARCFSMRIYGFRWPGLSSFTRCTCSS